MFPRIFKWKQSLEDLDSMNRATYQVMNLCLVFMFAALGYVSLAFAPELLSPGLGKKLLGIITAFWLLRLALQFRFYRVTHPAALLLNLFFMLTALTYAFPLLKAR
jgi:hypothetical protein